MTAAPAEDTANHLTEQKAEDPIDEAHPLSAFVRGTLTIHFDGGSVVERATSQFDARSFLDKQRGDETSDRLAWDSQRWFTWASERVVYSSFDADTDQNWPLAPVDRRRLAGAGHEHGVIASLVRLWERRARRDEPWYSVRVVLSLHHAALDGVSGPDWEAVARHFEGPTGAAQAARVWRATRPTADDVPAEAAKEPSEEPEAPEVDQHQPDDVHGDRVQEDEGDGAAPEDGTATDGEPSA